MRHAVSWATVDQRQVLASMTREFAMVCPSVVATDDGSAFVLTIAKDAPERQEAHLRATADIRFGTRVKWRVERGS